MQKACLLKHHVVSRPCDLSTVVTCRHFGRALFEDTLRCIGCFVQMYLTELARSDLYHNDDNKDGGVDDTATGSNDGGDDDDDGDNLLIYLLTYPMEHRPS